MKAGIRCGIVALCEIVLVSCGTALKEVTLKSQSERLGIFKEVQEGEPVSKELVELTIASSIKTHPEGHYLLESEKSLHGKAGYPFVINIDGQAATWKVDGQNEDTPSYDEKGKRVPEGGKGVRYNLQKKILLREGTRTVFFGLPEEKVLLQFEITLKAGESCVLEFKPVYGAHHSRPQDFQHGVSRIEVFLNGNEIKPLK